MSSITTKQSHQLCTRNSSSIGYENENFPGLRVSNPIFLTFSDSDENLVLSYFDYADFKNLVGLAPERRILELSVSDLGLISVRAPARNSTRTLVRTSPLIDGQIKVLFGICYVNLASNACFSVLASFFDKVSEDHGASKSEVGFIFAIFAGINVIVSPIFGYLVPIIGINFMFISGMTLAGGCALLFRYFSSSSDSLCSN